MMTNNISLFGCVALALCSAAAIGCAGEVAGEDDLENIGAVAQALDQPDLIVLSYTQECLATAIKQTVVIKNQGTASAPYGRRFSALMTGCTSSPGHPCYGAGWGVYGFALAAGATDASSTSQAVPGSGWTCEMWASMNGSWQITVDPVFDVAESNETNNVSTFPNTF